MVVPPKRSELKVHENNLKKLKIEEITVRQSTGRDFNPPVPG